MKSASHMIQSVQRTRDSVYIAPAYTDRDGRLPLKDEDREVDEPFGCMTPILIASVVVVGLAMFLNR